MAGRGLVIFVLLISIVVISRRIPTAARAIVCVRFASPLPLLDGSVDACVCLCVCVRQREHNQPPLLDWKRSTIRAGQHVCSDQ